MMPFNPSPFPTFPEPPFKDEEANAVAFVSVDEPVVLSPVAESVKAAQQAAAQTPVKVRVCDRYRVVWEGKAFIGGETLCVPAETAERWLKFKFVEKVSRGKK